MRIGNILQVKYFITANTKLLYSIANWIHVCSALTSKLFVKKKNVIGLIIHTKKTCEKRLRASIFSLRTNWLRDSKRFMKASAILLATIYSPTPRRVYYTTCRVWPVFGNGTPDERKAPSFPFRHCTHASLTPIGAHKPRNLRTTNSPVHSPL